MDGVEVLKKIKAHDLLKTIPVIMLTTTDDPKEVEACYQYGCNLYITKPIDLMKFAETIRQEERKEIRQEAGATAETGEKTREEAREEIRMEEGESLKETRVELVKQVRQERQETRENIERIREENRGLIEQRRRY